MYPLPIESRDSLTANTLTTLNHYFDPNIESTDTGTYTQTRTAEKLANSMNLHILAEIRDAQLIDMVNETGDILTEVDVNPEKGFARGIFKDNFDPARLALPPAKPSTWVHDHTKWTEYLDANLRADITTNFERNFADPIIKAIQENTKLPTPMNYCKPGTYPQLLNKMNQSGLLHWRLDEVRNTRLSNYAHLLQLTIFAITKSIHTDRLISWPRLANYVSLLPPKPDLPDSSLFEYLCVEPKANNEEAGIYLDVANMFHNMPLPIPMTDLFPLPTISFAELDQEAQASILKATGAPSLHDDTIIRPSQATMPMGFTWAVVLAHNSTTNIIQAAYTAAAQTHTTILNSTRLTFFNRASAPFMLSKGTALALAIIDDITILFAGWGSTYITAFHAELASRLNKAGLPIAADKSIKVGEVERHELPFIGNVLNLTDKTVKPMTKRIGKLAAFFRKYDIGKLVPYPVWASLVGRLVSYSMLQRGILAQFN